MVSSALAHQTSRGIVLQSERTMAKKSPFAMMAQLAAIVSKCRTSEDCEWCVSTRAAYVQRGHYFAGDFSFRNLTGKGSHNKGLLDLGARSYMLLFRISGHPYRPHYSIILTIGALQNAIPDCGKAPFAKNPLSRTADIPARSRFRV